MIKRILAKRFRFPSSSFLSSKLMYHLLLIKKESDRLIIEALKASLTEITALVHIQLRRSKKLFYIVSVSITNNSNTQLES